VRIAVKRVYDAPSRADGRRVLVDRLWPRGLSKSAAALDDWARDLAPSDQLRRWFGHAPGRWAEFKARYFRELEAKAERVEELRQHARGARLTLLFGARDPEHNNAVARREYLIRRR
jgi:uncharacterized protein YeaO (DUF488 family)